MGPDCCLLAISRSGYKSENRDRGSELEVDPRRWE